MMCVIVTHFNSFEFGLFLVSQKRHSTIRIQITLFCEDVCEILNWERAVFCVAGSGVRACVHMTALSYWLFYEGRGACTTQWQIMT